MSTGASKNMCSIEAEEATIGRGEDGDGEDSPGRELAARALGLLLRPPRLEDAGLEDCALTPESIHEAFSIAAKSLESRRASAYYSEDDEDERDIEGGTFGTCVEVRPSGSGDEATVGSEGTSGVGAMGRGVGFSEENALDCYDLFEDCRVEGPSLEHDMLVPGNGATGTGTGGEQTEQFAGSYEDTGICKRAGKARMGYQE